jgi:hypothetical protein
MSEVEQLRARIGKVTGELESIASTSGRLAQMGGPKSLGANTIRDFREAVERMEQLFGDQ